MKCLTMVAFAVASTIASVAAAQDVKRTYDKFNDYTTVAAPLTDLPNNVTIRLSYICRGDVPGCRPTHIQLFLGERSSEWKHLEENSVILLLNGTERVRLGDAAHKGSAEQGYVLEYREVSIPLPVARRIAAAHKVEVQWSLTEFTLPESVQANLRSLLLTVPVSVR